MLESSNSKIIKPTKASFLIISELKIHHSCGNVSTQMYTAFEIMEGVSGHVIVWCKTVED